MPVSQQTYVFYKAKIVIGPHGAGLSHILACAPGTIIIEVLQSNPKINLVFLDLSAQLEMRYYPLHTTIYAPFPASPLEVNVEDVISILHEVLPNSTRTAVTRDVTAERVAVT